MDIGCLLGAIAISENKVEALSTKFANKKVVIPIMHVEN